MIYLESLLFIVLEVLCCVFFINIFAYKRYDNNYINCIIVLGEIIYTYVVALFLQNNFALRQIIFIMGTAFLMTIYYKVNIISGLVLVGLYQGLLLASDYFVMFTMMALFNNAYLGSIEQNVAGQFLVVIARIIVFMLIIVLQKWLGKKNGVIKELQDMELLKFIFFPIFSIIAIVAMMYCVENAAGNQSDMLLIVAVCLAVMNIVVFYIMKDILRKEHIIRERKIYEQNIKNEAVNYRSLADNYKKQRKRIHEYKNEIMCIQGLYEEKRYDELEQYLKQVSGNILKQMDTIHTNNAITDVILNTKYQQMQDKNIIFIFNINDLSKLSIKDEYIVTILYNLLDNAVEACEKLESNRIIKLKFIMEEYQTIISVKNTFDGTIVKENGELVSTKKDHPDEHGIGVKNIITTVNNCGGSYSIRYDDREFYFSIMLPNEQEMI